MINKPYRHIEGFEEYMITNDGEVWSYKDKPKSRKGLKKLKPKLNKVGYHYIDCVDGKRKKRFAIHRLVAMYFCKGYFEGAVVNHIDADISNNHYTNLEWVTHKDNINKSYLTSGLNQVRHYRLYSIIYPCGQQSQILKGKTEVLNYINDNNLPISHSMIMKHKQHNGYNMVYMD